MCLHKMEKLEEEAPKGYIEPNNLAFEELTEEEEQSQVDDFARKIILLVFSVLSEEKSHHFFQLKKEELLPLSQWSQEALWEAIYLALTRESYPIYLYLEEKSSLLVLDNSLSCPVYSQSEPWMKRLRELVTKEELAIT